MTIGGSLTPSLRALRVAPGAREAEPVNVKAERGLNVGHVQDGTREPVCHKLGILE